MPVNNFALFDCTNYRVALAAYLDGPLQQRPRGAVTELARALKCHSTFISHVIKGKADLNTHQALRLCRHFTLNADETAYFMDLVEHDKAADTETRTYFADRLIEKRRERHDLAKRLKVDAELTAIQEALYFQSWLYQATHIYCQLPGEHTAPSIAAALRADQGVVEQVLRVLIELGFVKLEAGFFRSIIDFFHLRSDSTVIAKSHYNWRLKTTDELLHSGSKLPGRHYSSVCSMSLETAREIENLILQHIEATRQKIIPSPPDKLFVYCLDFYPLTK